MVYVGSPRWMFDVRGQMFRLRVDEVEGSIDNYSAAVVLAAATNLAIFAGYNYYKMNVDLSKRFWHGESQFNYQGLWVGTLIAFGGPGR